MKDKTVNIGGNPYRLTALSAFDVHAVLDEFKAHAPDPVREVLDTAAMLPEDIRSDFIKRHLDAAFDRKRAGGTLHDPAFKSYLETADGAAKLVARMLRTHHPHLTPAQAMDLTAEGLAEYGDDFFRGLVPGQSPGAAD